MDYASRHFYKKISIQSPPPPTHTHTQTHTHTDHPYPFYGFSETPNLPTNRGVTLWHTSSNSNTKCATSSQRENNNLSSRDKMRY